MVMAMEPSLLGTPTPTAHHIRAPQPGSRRARRREKLLAMHEERVSP